MAIGWISRGILVILDILGVFRSFFWIYRYICHFSGFDDILIIVFRLRGYLGDFGGFKRYFDYFSGSIGI